MNPLHLLSVAPMLDWTDRFERYFLRLISRRVLLYTEMITTAALLHADADYLLEFDDAEHPLALQLGGSDAHELALCSRLGQDRGYDEINLNLGCPSNRVQNGQFGACLMLQPQRVAECTAAMVHAVEIPVSVKIRIGVDEHDRYEELHRFVQMIAASGVERFIVHARKAWLSGLSPKQNREIPPLKYETVFQLKQDFPHLDISLNGGVGSLEQSQTLLHRVDGVMIGREAYHNPWMLSRADELIYGEAPQHKSRHQVLEEFLPFVERQLSRGIRLHHITRHIIGLFHGCTGARAWRRYLSEQAHKPQAGIEVIRRAAEAVADTDAG
ncbi:MAG: tRNA dihydrouridine(20/20a) synthase DusA [gamma proteobacterium symbiont of Bathyaustriella thionipta]|nr:tRNA dihydrouridine(20/20a) synthase DusA [gamma proteobacterium symbiont of Bathyaustriella thionipta]